MRIVRSLLPSMPHSLFPGLVSLRPRVLAIDCGFSRVAAGLFAVGAGGRLVLRRLAIEPLPPAVTPAAWAEAVGRVLADTVRREHFHGDCRMALPGQQTLVKFVRTPVLKDGGQEAEVDFEARRSIPCPLEEVAWDHLVSARSETEMEIMFAAVRKDLAGKLHASARAAGLRVAQLVPASLALLHAFRLQASPRDPVLVAEIGARSTQLAFVSADGFFLRAFPLGGDAVTRTLAAVAGLDPAAAERLKLQILGGAPNALTDPAGPVAMRRATGDFAHRLHFELVRTTLHYRRRFGGKAPAVVHLTGGGSLLPELPAQLADKLGVRVVRYDPLREVAVLPGARTVAGGEACRLASLVGLASGLVDRSWPELSLVPRHLALAADARRHRSTLVAATALAVSAPLPLIWHSHRSAAGWEAATRAAERQLAPVRRLAAYNRDQLAQIDAVQARLGVATELIAARSDWLRFFADLQNRLGRMGDVWLETLRPAPHEDGARSAARRFLLEGRLLDRAGEVSDTGTRDRVRALLELLADSPYVARVEESRFVTEAPGLLHFALSVVPREEKLQ
jgi:type IV pilus assembly protein PilM